MRELAIFTTPEDAHVELQHDAGVTFQSEPGTANGRQAHILKIEGVPDGWGARLLVTADGYAPLEQRGVLLVTLEGPYAAFHVDDIHLTAARPFGDELSGLVVNGQFFQTVDGTPHTSIACSDFLLFKHYVEGGDIFSICDERAAFGFNEVRVFLGMKGGLGEFDPRPHLDHLPDFCELLHDRGLRMELTIFPDAQRWIPDQQAQRDLLHQVDERVPLIDFIEGMNEGNYLDNSAPGIAHEQLQQGRLWALGSGLQASGTMLPAKSYGTYHPARSVDWPRKVAHNGMEDVADKIHKPVKSNECKRPDEASYRESDFYDAGGGVTLLQGGGTFHSQSGKASTLFSPDERRCAEAWVAGAKAVPLKFQRGAYTAGHLSTCPIVHNDEWASRTYARILGNEACVTVMQRKPGWQLQPRSGWRVVWQHESVIQLER